MGQKKTILYKKTDGDLAKQTELNYSTPINPNLLDNSNFKINQRGQNTYMNNGWNVPIIDRWLNHQHTDVYVDDEGLKVVCASTPGEAWAGPFQRLEYDLEEGEVYTLSAYVSEVQGIWRIEKQPSAVLVNSPGFKSVTFKATPINPYSNEGNAVVIAIQSETQVDDYIKLKWIKLEKGPIATPYIPPNPTVELLKCQRYFQAHEIHGEETNFYQAGQNLSYLLHLPVPMRVSPTCLNLDELWYDADAGAGGWSKNLATFTAALIDNNSQILITCQFDSSATNYDMSKIRLHSGPSEGVHSVLKFSAEL